jgi:hypothetical protein
MHAPRGEDRRAAINQQVDSCDLFVGILWKRFGTPSGLANSGMEKEFRIAWERFQRGSIADILFYFCEQPWWPRSEEELDQFRQVVKQPWNGAKNRGGGVR